MACAGGGGGGGAVTFVVNIVRIVDGLVDFSVSLCDTSPVVVH